MAKPIGPFGGRRKHTKTWMQINQPVVAEASAGASGYLLQRFQKMISAIRENKDNLKFCIENVWFEGAVKEQLKKHCNFFDQEPLTRYIVDHFHLGYAASEDGQIFRVDWLTTEGKRVGVHYMLKDVGENSLDIWVLEVFDIMERNTEVALINQQDIKKEVGQLSRSGFLTGVQELVKFGVRVLTRGAGL
ncbi:hypothetical protein [Palleronia caenipelagi]|uniref:Uncharacterized protein n=1 Tax=Palleronia caenipelagi TaxID=2489174 RepID=A0A547PN32_9RHOB|nr:hypothetical protein [Palleronia caenipelagi]TRD15562.1 hypothetical protein FEV53_15875 [Palleronia caenipelagi]